MELKTGRPNFLFQSIFRIVTALAQSILEAPTLKMRSNRGPTAKFKKNVIAGNKFKRSQSRKRSDVVDCRRGAGPRQIQGVLASDLHLNIPREIEHAN